MKFISLLLAAAVALPLAGPFARAGSIDASRMPASGWAGQVGIPGGIPTNYTQFCNVRVAIPGSNLKAAGDGVADDTAALQAAVSLCPNGQFVYLPAGTYRTTAEISRIGPNNWDYVSHPYSILIRGEGAGRTRISNQATSDGNILGFYYNGGMSTSIVSGNTRGSTSITLSSPLGYISVGGYVQILRDNAAAGATNDAGYMGNTASQIVKVTAISGSTLSFSPALNEGYPGDFAGVASSGPVRCGVEDLSLDRATNVAGHNIFFQGAQECWVKGVDSNKARKWHIRLEFSARCEVRQCVLHETWDGGGDSGYGVGLFRYCCNNLVEDNIGYHLRHAYILEYGGQGNVISYNYSREPLNENQLGTDYLMGDLILHGGHPRYNLFEGNVAATVRFDDVLGGSNFNTAFRNRIQRKGLPSTKYALYGTDLQRWNYSANLVGNVYEPANELLRRWGTDQDGPTLDPNSQASAYLDGEVDLGSGTTTWAGGDHSLPNSYYLTSRPSFFGSLTWPAIGPGIAVPAPGAPATVIPAVVRYYASLPNHTLLAPSNLRVSQAP